VNKRIKTRPLDGNENIFGHRKVFPLESSQERIQNLHWPLLATLELFQYQPYKIFSSLRFIFIVRTFYDRVLYESNFKGLIE
jgi:hypothetical protein